MSQKLFEVAAQLAKLQATDPGAFSNLMLPFLVSVLWRSPLRDSYNALSVAIDEKPPAGLKDTELSAWKAKREDICLGHIVAMGQWLNDQKCNARKLLLGGTPVVGGWIQ